MRHDRRAFLVASTAGFAGFAYGSPSGDAASRNAEPGKAKSTILFFLPSFLLGGVFYPISSMPEWAQAIADFIPIRYFIVMIRGVFLKGIGVETMWQETLILAALSFSLLLIAIFRFRKRSA